MDCGYGKRIKSLVQNIQDERLESDQNIDLWWGNSEIERLTAKSRRILIAHWVGETFEKLKSDAKFDAVRCRCFEKTGYLITADGSEDEKIKPGGYLTT